jgi:hypothetical protein
MGIWAKFHPILTSASEHASNFCIRLDFALRYLTTPDHQQKLFDFRWL